ncbi:hypothetical protein RF679_07380 [Undibacterium cyanobacteriorum]|uniref:DUF5610 domain-containing protein n=1 Tax=Undibacterium cyanobacteriorum TaxID=3073561 RepID=A0ABY9RLK7_9BURK|nr:hypothetical protein [Undibacterium sp. 20NA77.5]WMW82098.1 hypothetical protein RF679_07380 [Undibacterium sp. 20NA77.5]
MTLPSINSNLNAFDKLYSTKSTESTAASSTVAKLSSIDNNVSNNTIQNPAATGSGNKLNSAIQQALVQLNAGRDISAFFNSDEGQDANNNFTSNILSQLPGLNQGNDGASTNTNTPIKLDPNSTSIQLQFSIQKLITQLDSGNNASAAAGLGTLQESFNTLISKSGGEPSSQNLQSFLKLVAVNVQGSTSLGSIFSTSA